MLLELVPEEEPSPGVAGGGASPGFPASRNDSQTFSYQAADGLGTVVAAC